MKNGLFGQVMELMMMQYITNTLKKVIYILDQQQAPVSSQFHEILVDLQKISKLDLSRKRSGGYTKIIRIWGHQSGQSIPNIDLVAGPHRPGETGRENFFRVIFELKNTIF